MPGIVLCTLSHWPAMSIDAPTMALMIGLMQFLCGGLLIYAALHYRDAQAAVWWGVSHIILSIGVALSIVGGVTGTDWITAGAFVVFVSCAAAQWHGTRLLTGDRAYLPLVFVGPALIAAVNLLPVGDALPMVRGIAATVLNLAYFTGAIVVLVRPAGGRLTAYLPLAVLFGLNVIAVGLGPLGGLGSTETGIPPLLSFGGLIYLQGQIFVIGTTIFVFAAVRERKEKMHRDAASTDPLTGLPNRRSFFEQAEKLTARAQIGGTPFSVAAMDLDHFKEINDQYGHATGDEVLRLFAQVARKSLRPSDVIGRVGGEEFTAVIHGSDPEASLAIAERVRKTFQAAAELVQGKPVQATLCVGLAASRAGASLETLMKEADAALYLAKQRGRNRVESAPDAQPPAPNKIARVA